MRLESLSTVTGGARLPMRGDLKTSLMVLFLAMLVALLA
jgi:hypothetical protein